MEGLLDPFDFQLAEALHKSVAEVQSLSHAEYIGWRAFFKYRAAMRQVE